MKLTREEALNLMRQASGGILTQVAEDPRCGYEIKVEELQTFATLLQAKTDSAHVDKPLAESAVAPGECGSVPDGSDHLRLSTSGYSLRVGWGDQKRTVAASPRPLQELTPAAQQQWIDDAKRLCDAWNRRTPVELSAQTAVKTEQPSLSDERELFEAHIRSTTESVPPNNTWFLERSEAVPDMYYNQRYDDMWKGWQAAISAQRQDSNKEPNRAK